MKTLAANAWYLLWAAGYLFRTRVLRREVPFIGGLVINEKCNLSCRHCAVANRAVPDLTFAEAGAGLDLFRGKGIRSVFIEGGEPFLWRDGARRLEDVIALARKKGFRLVSVYTNGTFPIDCSADSVFVSLDGLKATNDRLRGPSFDRALANIRASAHPNIIINFTINSENAAELEDFCRFAAAEHNVRGVFFYFHTPYYGRDALLPAPEAKKAAVGKLVELKRRGFPVFNSEACLGSVRRDDWKRPSKLCYVYAANRTYECCRANGNAEACANCGYLGYPEIIHILQLRPSAVLSALNYLPRGRAL